MASHAGMKAQRAHARKALRRLDIETARGIMGEITTADLLDLHLREISYQTEDE